VFCNGVETCSASSGCQPGTPVDCTDNDICTDDSCNEATKACDHIFDPTNDPSCVSVCGNGRVETGEQCDDGNTVSGDCCSSTCQFDAAGAPCNDGLFCTVGETCNGSGACGGGTPRDCSDAFSCTTDSCSEATDACVHTPDDAACSDGVFCNGVETCSATLGCQAGTPVDCNDNDICTDDACNESAQRCDHVFDATNAPGCGGTVTWPAWRGPLADSRYAGSQACAGCHPAQYQSWAGSLHARMLIPPGNAQAAGFVLPDNNSVPGTTISITSWSDVLFVVGEKWKTLYVDRTGQIQRAQWNYATGQWNSHPGGPYDCGACHTTGYNPAPTFTDPAGQPVPGIAGTWVEYNIGCEACHGPGAEHAAAPTNSNINRIVLDWTATGEGTRTPSIRSAEVCGNCHYRSDHSGTLDPQRRSESQFNDWLAGRHSSTLETTTLSTYCAKCHSPGNATADSEEHYFSYFDPKEATHVACVSCHDPHGASNGRWATLRWPNGGRQDPKNYPAAIARYRGTDNNPATSDHTPVDPSLSTQLCTDCHKTQPGFRRHVDASPPTTVTLHPPANFGQPFVVPHMEHIEEGNAQCVSCHMPYSRTSINPDDVRTHSFVPNEVEIGGSVHYSVTCGQCHDEAQDCVWCHGEFARRTVNTPAGNAPGRRPGKREHASPVAP
jgi:cysteine-rich repeat protein